MLAMHPRTIRTAAIVLGTLVIDMDTSTGTRRAVELMHRFGYTLGNGIEVVSDFIVQSPCKLLPYLGQHVGHRSSSNDNGDWGCTVYRFPVFATPQEVYTWLESNNLRFEPEHCYHSYDCCANYYVQGTEIIHRKEHTLAIVRWIRNV
jgi:hypothetical protein